jgi:UDP-N-acetylmuramyl pentapeptide phosphotransferase/UDP-N-acetylglucosamine-1-phosphate transferase
MPLMNQNLRALTIYIGIGITFVCLVVAGAFYAPTVLGSASRWIVFVAVSGIVFGYQLRDFWPVRASVRFWLPFTLLFACHLAFWVSYVHPHFHGDPRLFTAFLLAFGEFVVVSIVMKVSARSNAKNPVV